MKRLIYAILLSQLSFLAHSQTLLTIKGDVEKTVSLDAAAMEKMTHVDAVVRNHKGEMKKYSAIPIQDLLGLAKVSTGKDLHGENLRKILIVKCSDGYAVVFSLAELDSSFTDRVVALADQSHGNDITEKDGPLRLIVPNEKRPARSCFQVKEFIIQSVKEN